MIEETFVLTGRVLFKRESYSFWGQKRMELQILLEDDEEYKKINKVLLNHLEFIGSLKRSSAMPPCITFKVGKSDTLFIAEVGQTVELLFMGRKYHWSEYAMSRGMCSLAVVWPEITTIKC